MTKPERRKRCFECNELVPPEQLRVIKDEVWDDNTDATVMLTMLVCEDCIEEWNEPGYGIFGEREDQISFDSAMFRED